MNDTERQVEVTKSATIMMVDDEPTTLDVLEELLRAQGYRKFVSTTDPTRVLAVLGEEQPNVLLLNLLMPHMSGLEILDAMRGNPALRDIPVIILTSSTDAEAKRRALELGAADFLAKPVDPSELTLRLQGTLLANAYRIGLESKRVARKVSTSERMVARADPPVMSRLDGKNPRFRSIIENFVAGLRIKLDAMEASWEAGNFEELASLAHWLKGAAGTVGFDAFTAPAQTLNALAREGKHEDIEASIRELRELTDRILVSTGSDA